MTTMNTRRVTFESPSETIPKWNLGASGYVSGSAGSVASANAYILRGLLDRGHHVDFYSKPSFVDPRPVVAGSAGKARLSFFDCTNTTTHEIRTRLQKPDGSLPGWRRAVGLADHRLYLRTINLALRAANTPQPSHNAALWLGTWASRSVPGVPTVSWAQGPPGTDARSIRRHRDEIIALGGRSLYAKLAAFATWRLGLGLPRFNASDHLIVGSDWSRKVLQESYGLEDHRVHALPYPIDLDLFRPPVAPRSPEGPLRVIWLGRLVPRKRLPLFLDAIAEAIRQGIDVRATVIGRSGFVPNYERFLEAFSYPDRLTHLPSVARMDVPAVMAEQDVLIQPSDDENFGSSVAEAQACGMPVIVGATNGTGDYVCERSIRLANDRTETLLEAIAALAEAKRSGGLADGSPCREAAERHCDPARVVASLEEVLRKAIAGGA